MVDRLLDSLWVVALGFVTGAFGACIVGALLLRRLGSPGFQGRRATIYLAVCFAVFLGMTAYVFVSPWTE